MLTISVTKRTVMLGFLNRNLYHAPQSIKEYTYKQLALPLIDYCSAIWDPYTKNDISKLEMLQYRAMHFVIINLGIDNIIT